MKATALCLVLCLTSCAALPLPPPAAAPSGAPAQVALPLEKGQCAPEPGVFMPTLLAAQKAASCGKSEERATRCCAELAAQPAPSFPWLPVVLAFLIGGGVGAATAAAVR